MPRWLILLVLLLVFGVLIYIVASPRPSVYKATSAVPLTNEFTPKTLRTSIFAENVDGARDLQFSPGGTLLVSLTRNGQVVAVPGPKIILSGLTNPHGLAFHDGKLFVAEEGRVVRYAWDEQKKTAVQEKVIATLPAGGRHFTRSLEFDTKGNLYISVGSTCDSCFEKDPKLAAVLITDADGNNLRVFATGLRNAVFLKREPSSGKIYDTEMGRDYLGDVTPPDEINILQEKGNYGWPVCYGNRIFDKNFNSGKLPSYCDSTIEPYYNLPSHVAPLGLTFINSPLFPKEQQGDMLVAEHGSWNSSVPVGYKIVRLHREGGRVVDVVDFKTDFMQNGQVIGRPVDVEFDNQGRLYVSDDKAGVIYLIQ